LAATRRAPAALLVSLKKRHAHRKRERTPDSDNSDDGQLRGAGHFTSAYAQAPLEPQLLGLQDLPAFNLYGRGSDSSQWSTAIAGTTMNDPLDSHMQSMCGVEASFHATPCGYIENSDLNPGFSSDRRSTNEASESVATSR
jgi:hypothetical protein